MSKPGNRENSGRTLSTADLAAAVRRPNSGVADSNAEPALNEERMPQVPDRENEITSHSLDVTETKSTREALEPLFTPELAETYRGRWAAIQSGFVDDPKQAVRSGDELVAQIMTNLANTFAEERHRVETQLDDSGESSTENLRVALRRYRSFFERLLSL
jgi:hypothetical protein